MRESKRGLHLAHGRALVQRLLDWTVQPDFRYRHDWKKGDLLMWDNCSSQHQAVADYALPQRRRMHRTTITGTVPF